MSLSYTGRLSGGRQGDRGFGQLPIYNSWRSTTSQGILLLSYHAWRSVTSHILAQGRNNHNLLEVKELYIMMTTNKRVGGRGMGA